VSVGRATGTPARVYWEVGVRSFRRYATYRAATIAGTFTNTVFGFMKAAVLLAVWKGRPEIGGYDVTDALTYTFIGQGLIMVLSVFGPGLELSERIRTGDVAIDLYRPVDFQAWWLATDVGRSAFQVAARGLPPFVAGALIYDLRVPGPAGVLAFVVSLGLALLVSFGLRYLTSLAGFWIIDVRGLQQLALTVTIFMSGMVVPLVLFPAGLEGVARALPWAAMVQGPADVFLGQRVWSTLAAQTAWAAVLLAAGRLVGGAARRRVVVQGG